MHLHTHINMSIYLFIYNASFPLSCCCCLLLTHVYMHTCKYKGGISCCIGVRSMNSSTSEVEKTHPFFGRMGKIFTFPQALSDTDMKVLYSLGPNVSPILKPEYVCCIYSIRSLFLSCFITYTCIYAHTYIRTYIHVQHNCIQWPKWQSVFI